MGRPKREIRQTSYVTLRTKPLSKGRESLYLDINKNGKRRYEFLGLYLVPVTDEYSRTLNENTMLAANAIRSRREVEIIQGKGGLDNTQKARKMKLQEWMGILKSRKAKTGQSAHYSNLIGQVAGHLKEFAGDNIRLSDVDKRFCVRFIEYLKHAKSRRKPFDTNLSIQTISRYFSIFSSVMAEAVRKGYLLSNPSILLTREEKKPIRAIGVHRDYLTIEEVRSLMDTECRNSAVKAAFLFACFTGLRISDIRNLTWDNIKHEREGLYLCIVMQKTGEPLKIKLNRNAEKWLPERKDDMVFQLPVRSCTLNGDLKRWAKRAGIEKNVCFHMSRHTFATMGLTLGADLFEVSKLLGHKDIKVTQVYADLINEKLDRAVDRLDKAFMEEGGEG